MTRLGSKMPFAQAVEEVWLSQRTRVEESTLRRTTYRHGAAAEMIEEEEAARIEREKPRPTAKPKKALVSADGAFIHLTSGEWREVKTLVIGEFDTIWNAKAGKTEVKTKNLSYFSRSYPIREFERGALAELHRRGLENADLAVTVNDGSSWIQSFVEYHLPPDVVRILDFRHATDYLVVAGQSVLGEGTDAYRRWIERMVRQLKEKPPARTLADLKLLEAKAQTEEQRISVAQAYHYLQRREELIDYPHFQERGFPIGSGSAESSHKVVVHSRMKQAGMRWAEAHVDPLLALRNLICNDRWSEGWRQIGTHYWRRQRQESMEQARRQRPVTPPIVLPPAPKKPRPIKKAQEQSGQSGTQPYRPDANHPWRRGLWPTKESWRWR
jgi:hypothetical protein